MTQKATKEPLEVTLGFRVTAQTYKTIEAAMRQERRIESDICRLLLDRGVAAYRKDGSLFEPPEDRPGDRRAAGSGRKH